MCLRVIIDRSEFIPEFVSLGRNDYGDLGSGTFYLLLPVIRNEYKDAMTIDWKLIRRCLSSPLFRMQEAVGANRDPHRNGHVYLANGPRYIEDVVNSLVYAPSKDLFFFVADVILDKNAHSEYKESRTFVEHYEM